MAAARFQPEGRVTDGVVAMLQKMSADRVTKNEKFGELAEDIARYKKRKDEKTISLAE